MAVVVILALRVSGHISRKSDVYKQQK